MTKLYEANNHILIRTGYGTPGKHSHLAAHIIISLGEKMCFAADGGEYVCPGILIPSGMTHMVDTSAAAALVFLYDCTSDVARQIQSIRCIPEEVCRKIAAAYSDFEGECTTEAYRQFESFVLSLLGFTIAGSPVMDERIQSAMEYIRSGFSDKLSCKQVAGTVFLSESRFSHLFRQQVGMTFASYLICQRLLFVYARILQGVGITQAALEAGFASSAHFSDTNRRVFGLSASAVLRDLVFVKLS